MKNLSNEYQNKRILIVGSNGYIASNLISVLINYKCELILFDLEKNNDFNFKNSLAKTTEVYGDVYGDIWIKKYSSALLIMQWGTKLK